MAKKKAAKKKVAKKKSRHKKKTSKKKSKPKAVARGRKAVQKGRKFEDDVAELYHLLGAHVKQNIMICSKKVDALATFKLPGSSTQHRVIVECKDEKRPRGQNQRVMQFQGLLETTRKAGEADSAEIITRIPWSDQAKGFAHKSGIELLTYTEKISQLIDFSRYLKTTIDRFEKVDRRRPSEPPLGAYYVDLSAEQVVKNKTKRIHVIDTYVQKWLGRQDTERQLAILGEYGTGKSSFCQKLAHDLAVSYLKATASTRIPIVLNLREFTKTLKIESLVLSFLDEECGVMNPRFKLFEAMNDAGAFVLVFDGFDEMAVRVDQDTLEMNLQEIEKLAAGTKAKVIITSRPEYFVTSKEQETSLSPGDRLLATRGTEYKPLHIVLWKEPQVNLFLKKRVPLIKKAKKSWTYYRDRIKQIADLSDLSRRPVLLDMIVKTLPQLISSGKPINRPNLYETYLMGEIRRQKILKKRALLLTDTARFSLLQHLSLDFFTGEMEKISFGDAMTHMEELVKPPKAEIEAYTRDFLTCSFLMRKRDEYFFSHKSIMEYLVAQGLKNEIEKDSPDAFGRQILEPGVTAFMAELKPDRDMLLEWIKSTRSSPNRDITWLGGNAATLLCKLDPGALKRRNLSRTVLNGANLNFSDLRGTSLDGASLTNVRMIGAKFLRESFKKARIRNFIVTVFILQKKSLSMEESVTRLHEFNPMAVHFRLLTTDLTLALLSFSLVKATDIESLRNKLGKIKEVQAHAVFEDEIRVLSKQITLDIRTVLQKEPEWMTRL